MDLIIKYLRGSFYTQIIAFVCSIIGFLISIARRKQSPNYLNVFTFYFLSYIILDFIVICSPIVYSYKILNKFKVLNNISIIIDLLFTVIEFLTFIIFFIKILDKSINKLIVKTINYVFLVSIFVIYTFEFISLPQLKLSTLQNLYSFQAICLLIPCFLYYLEIFKAEPILILTNDPKFWIVTGLSFFMICTFPFSLFTNYFKAKNPLLYNYMYSIFYIFYALLFIMISRSYLCKKLTVN
jgi:hypothetical protein